MQFPEGKVCQRTGNRSRNPRVFPCAPGKVARDRQDAAAACTFASVRIWSKNECGSWALGFLPIVVSRPIAFDANQFPEFGWQRVWRLVQMVQGNPVDPAANSECFAEDRKS